MGIVEQSTPTMEQLRLMTFFVISFLFLITLEIPRTTKTDIAKKPIGLLEGTENNFFSRQKRSQELSKDISDDSASEESQEGSEEVIIRSKRSPRRSSKKTRKSKK